MANRLFSFGNKSELFALLAASLAPGRDRYYTGLSDKYGNMLAEGSVVSVDGKKGYIGILLFGDFQNKVSSLYKTQGFFIIWNSPFIRHDFLYWFCPVKDAPSDLCVVDDLFRYENTDLEMEAARLKDIKDAVYYWVWENNGAT